MFDPVSLITGGIGLIGSLFGGDDKKTTETSESTSTSSIDYKAMVDAATSAGFNPLTAIRTGGASGFVTTNTKSKGESTTSGSGPNWGGIADAVGTIAGGLNIGMNNAADPIGSKSAKKGRAVSTALVDSQLRGAAKRPAGALYSAGQTIGTKVSSNAPSLRNQSKASSKGNLPGEGTLVGGDDPKVSSLGWNDKKKGFFHAPWMPDADTVENIYGDSELLSMGYGAAKLISDVGYTGYRNMKNMTLPWNAGVGVKPDAKYRKQYFDNIRSSVPSLAR